MRKNFGAKSWCYPQNVFIIATYNEDGSVDAMNATWGGIYDTNKIVLALSLEHKTVKNMLKRKAFTISMADEENVIPCDYVGIVSGNKDPNKFNKTGWHFIPSKLVDAPIITELKMALECKLASYDEKEGIFIGEIVNVSVDESALTNGTIDTKKVKPITFDPVNSAYYGLGNKVGDAWKAGLKLK